MSLAKEYFTTKMKRINRYIDAGKTEKAKDEVADLVGFAAYATCRGITFRECVHKEYPQIFPKVDKHSDLMSLVAFDEFMPDSLSRVEEDDEEEESLDDFLAKLAADIEDEDEDEEEDDLDDFKEAESDEDVTDILKRIFGKRK